MVRPTKTSVNLSSSVMGTFLRFIPANTYLLKVKNRNTRTRCKICSNLTIKTQERRQ